jgi:hypothetical protein
MRADLRAREFQRNDELVKEFATGHETGTVPLSIPDGSPQSEANAHHGDTEARRGEGFIRLGKGPREAHSNGVAIRLFEHFSDLPDSVSPFLRGEIFF